MVEIAWDEYRSWAKRSHVLQRSVQRWNLAALSCAALAALLGAAASQVPAESTAGRVLAGLAAVAAALMPILGRYMLEIGGEAGWIRARATAEDIKSESFLFAAAAGDYSKPDAQAKFIEKRAALSMLATDAGLTPQDDPVGQDGDKRRPPVPMAMGWYVQNRLHHQAQFYRTRAADYEQQISQLRAIGLACALAGAVLGGMASALRIAGLTPWIGVATTLGAVVVAYGLMERRQYLAASYAAMRLSSGNWKSDSASRAATCGT